MWEEECSLFCALQISLKLNQEPTFAFWTISIYYKQMMLQWRFCIIAHDISHDEPLDVKKKKGEGGGTSLRADQKEYQYCIHGGLLWI